MNINSGFLKASFLLPILLSAVSCYTGRYDADAPTPVVFSAKNIFSEEETKATPVENLSSFNILCTTGSAGSETRVWSGTATKVADTYVTGQYWPASDAEWMFSMSNASLTYSAAGATVSVDGTTDVVCCYMPDAEYKARNTPVFHHILARVGALFVSVPDEHTFSPAAITVTNAVTSGTYNLRTGAWSALGTPASAALSAGDNDIWLIPGTYSLNITGTLSRGGTDAAINSTGTMTLMAGTINTVTVVISTQIEAPAAHTGDVNDEEVGGVAVPDVLVNHFDANGDGILSREEAESVTDLGYIFRNNKEITEVDLTAFSNLESIAIADFLNCTNLTTVILPEGLTVIHRNAFKNCTSLVDVTLPSTLEVIEDSAFYDCDALTQITIPASVTRFDARTFYGCGLLASVTILATTPPELSKSNSNGGTVSNGNWFGSCASSLKIYVPSGSVSAYQSATNWSRYSAKITAIP